MEDKKDTRSEIVSKLLVLVEKYAKDTEIWIVSDKFDGLAKYLAQEFKNIKFFFIIVSFLLF